jgi:hypothetical protein
MNLRLLLLVAIDLLNRACVNLLWTVRLAASSSGPLTQICKSAYLLLFDLERDAAGTGIVASQHKHVSMSVQQGCWHGNSSNTC